MLSVRYGRADCSVGRIIGIQSSLLITGRTIRELEAAPPAISVIIPGFNSARYIAEAIQSVLDQTMPAAEIVVVDDGSKENDGEVAQSFGHPVKVFRRPHSGIGASRNFGVSVASGDLIAFLDSDDLWTADKLEKQVALLQQQPALDGCLGLVQQFYAPDLAVSAEQRKRLEDRVNGGYLVGALLIKRSAFEAVGRFEEERMLGDFIDWFARAQDAGLQLPVLDQLVLRRRIHGRNTVIRELSARGDYAKTLKTILDRRRASASEKGMLAQEER